MSDPIWDVLHHRGGQSAARFDWDLALFQWKTYPVFRQHYLQLTSHVATALDCPTPCDFGCPRRVIKHSDEEIIGLCDERLAPSVTLTGPQLSIYRLNGLAMGKAIARTLGITERVTHLENVPLTLRLGDFSAPTHESFPVILTLQDDGVALTHSVQALCLMYPGRFVLLAPTRQPMSPVAEQQLSARGCLFLALDELLTLAENGQFRLKRSESPFRPLVPGHYAELRDPLPANIFRQRGDQWEIRFQGGEIITLKRQKGLEYLTMLLASPGQSISALELYHQGKMEDEQRAMDLGRGMEVGDRQALEDYWKAIQEIDEDLLEARHSNDFQQVEDLQEKKESLLSEVSNMKGPGGKLRFINDPLRKPRDNVSKAIKRTVGNLAKANMNELAAHLQPMTMVQGGEISYEPNDPITWETQSVAG